MNLSRRGFLGGLLGLAAAPALAKLPKPPLSIAAKTVTLNQWGDIVTLTDVSVVATHPIADVWGPPPRFNNYNAYFRDFE